MFLSSLFSLGFLFLITHPPAIPRSRRGLEEASAGIETVEKGKGWKRRNQTKVLHISLSPVLDFVSCLVFGGGHRRALSESGEGSVGTDGGGN